MARGGALMRIGFDATVLCGPTRYSGGGRYAESLLHALVEQLDEGDEVVAFVDGEAHDDLPLPPRTAVCRIPRPPLGRLSNLAAHSLALPRLVARSGVDVYHSPTVHTRPSLPPAPARLPCPTVVTVHDVIPLSHYASSTTPMPARMRWFYRWNLRRALRADRLITVSSYSKAEIVEHASVPPDRVSVVHNGVALPECADPAAALRSYGLPPRFALYVGSAEPRKNLRRLVEAYALAAQRGLEQDLVLVTDPGSGHAHALRGWVDASGVGDRIRLLNGVAPDALAALYRAADCFAFPSLAEGFGLPPVEAMLSGTPVLASGLGSLPEVLGDGALYVDALDVTSIAEGLVALGSDEGLRRRLVAAGQEVAARYTWERAAAETLRVYREAIGSEVVASR